MACLAVSRSRYWRRRPACAMPHDARRTHAKTGQAAAHRHSRHRYERAGVEKRRRAGPGRPYGSRESAAAQNRVAAQICTNKSATTARLHAKTERHEANAAPLPAIANCFATHAQAAALTAQIASWQLLRAR